MINITKYSTLLLLIYRQTKSVLGTIIKLYVQMYKIKFDKIYLWPTKI